MNRHGKLLERFQQFVEQEHLIEPGVNVIVAVSGGVDSMTLLDLWLKSVSHWSIRLLVAHLNHQLRAGLAEADAELVRQYCTRSGVPFFYRSVDVRQYAREKHLSLELAGRELRYTFFQELAATRSPAVVATAHTADDNAETILLNLIKGRGMAGLAGIPVRRENIIRPLLFATKAELYAYARENQVPFNEDHTNRLATVQRNVIRNQILPLIEKQLNPRVKITLREHSQHWQAAVNYLTQAGRAAWQNCLREQRRDYLSLDRRCLTALPPILIREVLLQSLQLLVGTYVDLAYHSTRRFMELLSSGAVDKQCGLNPGWTAYFDAQQVLILSPHSGFSEELEVKIGAPIETDCFIFTAEEAPLPAELRQRPTRRVEHVDFDKIAQPLRLRPWRAGDRLRPLGMNGHKKVSDILIDKKIPRPLKKRVPLLVSGEQIIWVCGLVMAEEFKLTPTSRRALKIYYEEKV